jgi:hypothetical protein
MSEATATDDADESGSIGPSLVGRGTMVGGAVLALWAWIDVFFQGVTSTPGSVPFVAYDLVWVLGTAALLLGATRADAYYRDYAGPVGRAGVAISGIGFLSIGIGRLVHAAHIFPVDTASVGTTVFWAGVATALVGGLAVAVAGYLTGVPDRLVSGLFAIAPSAMLLELFAAVGLPAQVVGATAGFGMSLVPLGIAWMIVGNDVGTDRTLEAEATDEPVPGPRGSGPLADGDDDADPGMGDGRDTDPDPST